MLEEGLAHPPSQPSKEPALPTPWPPDCEKTTLLPKPPSVWHLAVAALENEPVFEWKNPRICKQGPLIMNGRVWAPTWTWGSFPQVSQSTLCLHHYEYKSSLFMIKCKNVTYLRRPPLDISGSPQVFNKLTSSPRSRGLVGRTVVHRTVSAYASLTAIFLGAPLMA